MCSNNFIFIHKLGEGSFGSVFKVLRKSDHIQYALKKVNMKLISQKNKLNALNEVMILSSISHPNIIGYKQAFYDSITNQLCFVMELAQNGDLKNYLQNKFRQGQQLLEDEIWQTSKDVLDGLAILHKHKILHRDIKPANVFFDAEHNAKLGDMNVSKFIDQQLSSQIGTPYYASPEVWNHSNYSFQIDIWSFGCLLYQMCCLQRPFIGKNRNQIYLKVQKCEYKKISSKYSTELQQVIQGCLKPKNQRLKLNQLLIVYEKHTLGKNIHNNQYNPALKTYQIIPDIDQDLKKILPKSNYGHKSQTLCINSRQNIIISNRPNIIDNYMINGIDKVQQAYIRRKHLITYKSEKKLQNNIDFSYNKNNNKYQKITSKNNKVKNNEQKNYPKIKKVRIKSRVVNQNN